MEKYSSYKDSGVQWLGQIPSHWKVNRIASFFTERKIKVSDKDFAPLSVTKMGVLPQLENVAKTDDGDNRKLVRTNDFVINSRSDRKGSSGVSPMNGSVSLINIVLEPKPGIYPGYCNHLLKSYAFIEEFYRNGHGIVADLWTTRYDEMKTIKIAIPPYSEQERISSYLDSATAKIDEAIAQQQSMINLLNERKQILIDRTVSKGIHTDTRIFELKDSGYEWLGQIPSHWSLNKLKYLCKMYGRIGFRGYSADDLVEEGDGAITLSPTNIIDGKLDFSECSYLSWPKYYESPEIMVFPGDVIFVKTASIGKTAYVESTPLETTVNPQILVIKEILPNSEFLTFYLQSSFMQGWIKATANGSTILTIPQTTIGNYPIALPPIEEQQEIVKYLKHEIGRIEQAKLSVNNTIGLLQERKQIIINDVVTGKVKVV